MKGPILAATAALCCALATPLAAQQSLSRVDILALQQQLRDDGCGIAHVTGRIDAVTRRAIKKCASKYNASGTDAASVLAAMNIGFGATATRGNNGQTPASSMGGTLPETPSTLPAPTTPTTPTMPEPSTPTTPAPTTPAPTTPDTTPSTPDSSSTPSTPPSTTPPDTTPMTPTPPTTPNP